MRPVAKEPTAGAGARTARGAPVGRGTERRAPVVDEGPSRPTQVPPLGERIRAERVRHGETVRGLARQLGVSASLISQIETDKTRPSVSTLYAITTALGVSVEDLLDAADNGRAANSIASTQVTSAHSEQGADGGADRSRRVGPVISPDQRESIVLDSGVSWQLLGQVPGVHVDFMLVTYEPGGTSSSSGLLMRHTGAEFGYIVSGQLVLMLGFEERVLSPGDTVSFESTTPHGYRNDGTEPAVGIWFVLDRGH